MPSACYQNKQQQAQKLSPYLNYPPYLLFISIIIISMINSEKITDSFNPNLSINEIKAFILKNLNVAPDDLNFMTQTQLMDVYVELVGGIKNVPIRSPKSTNQKTAQPQKQVKSNPSGSKITKVKQNLQVIDIADEPLIIQQSKVQNSVRQFQIKQSEQDKQNLSGYFFPEQCIKNAIKFDNKYRLETALYATEYLTYKNLLTYFQVQNYPSYHIKQRLSELSLPQLRNVKKVLASIYPRHTTAILCPRPAISLTEIQKYCREAIESFIIKKNNYLVDKRTQFEKAENLEGLNFKIRIRDTGEYVEGLEKQKLVEARSIKKANYVFLKRSCHPCMIIQAKEKENSVQERICFRNIFQVIEDASSSSEAESELSQKGESNEEELGWHLDEQWKRGRENETVAQQQKKVQGNMQSERRIDKNVIEWVRELQRLCKKFEQNICE